MADGTFEERLGRALEKVRLLLESSRRPAPAAEIHHRYEDKFHLAEAATRAALASQVASLASVGLGTEKLAALRAWAASARAVSLHFRCDERCTFLRKDSREVEGTTKHVQELEASLPGGAVHRAQVTSKVVTTEVRFAWKFEASYEIEARRGTGHDPAERLQVCRGGGAEQLETASESPPRPSARVPAAEFEVDITFLLQHLNGEDLAARFTIDREQSGCRTPRRNAEVEAALSHFVMFDAWCARVAMYMRELSRVCPKAASHLGNVDADAVLVPVLPLLEEREGQAASGVRLGSEDWQALLAEERRSLVAAAASAADVVAGRAPGGLVGASEARLLVTCLHCCDVAFYYSATMEYIEDMLRKQLEASLGKELTAVDIAEYMRFHHRKLFRPAYLPASFSFSVRRSEQHAPEGTVSIEEWAGGGATGAAQPIVTLAARSQGQGHMHFRLSASAVVAFGGERHLHAWLRQEFSGESGLQASLIARTHQFSAMVVLVGRVVSADQFEPKAAAILQNKDELQIPLELSSIPTPKEFRDAIESLSPEQQRFAKAIRAMQLGSTLFSILVIPVKPQLERVLNLPEDSLTKEIQLTQDLMRLFVKYQIPSDIVAAQRARGASAVGGELAEVRSRVEAMKQMISQAQQEELAERRQEAVHGAFSGQRAPEPPAKRCREGHALERNPLPRNICDVCDATGTEYRCASGCDWDMCGPCYVRGRDVMRVYVKDLPGKTWTCYPQRNGSIDDLTRLIYEQTGIPEDQQRLLFEHKQLTSGRSLADYNIQAESLLHLVLRLRGGGETEPPPRSCQEAPVTEPPPPSRQEAPVPAAQQQPEVRPPVVEQERAEWGRGSGAVGVERDYTEVPWELDRKCEALGEGSALRPSVIALGGTWSKRQQKALLAAPETVALGAEEQKAEREAAFDLLDALTRSGALPIARASLHTLVAATHCFGRSVIETLVQDNENPIHHVERSALIMAAVVHQKAVSQLTQESQHARLCAVSPALFLEDATQG